MAQHVAAEQLTITDWVEGLAAIPGRDFSPRKRPGLHHPPLGAPGDASTNTAIFQGQLHSQPHLQERRLRVHDYLLEIARLAAFTTIRDQNCWMSAPIGR